MLLSGSLSVQAMLLSHLLAKAVSVIRGVAPKKFRSQRPPVDQVPAVCVDRPGLSQPGPACLSSGHSLRGQDATP